MKWSSRKQCAKLRWGWVAHNNGKLDVPKGASKLVWIQPGAPSLSSAGQGGAGEAPCRGSAVSSAYGRADCSTRLGRDLIQEKCLPRPAQHRAPWGWHTPRNLDSEYQLGAVCQGDRCLAQAICEQSIGRKKLSAWLGQEEARIDGDGAARRQE